MPQLTALIERIAPRITALRRDLHAHPELAFNERRTADIAARRLEELGLEVHRGLAKTGVVGVLRAGQGAAAIGLRADMDALPLAEKNTFDHRSQHEGCMHACGHDGHTAMLLGAAELLSQTRNFDGTVYFIFQPAEEHEGGARVMVEEGLFERFPMNQVFGLHNWPGLPAGEFAVMDGPVMAGADRFEITLNGGGGHAAMPHQAVDCVVAGAALVQALQTLVSRETDPLDATVLSITRFQAGCADNVLPDQAILGGTVRYLAPRLQAQISAGMRRICAGVAATHGTRGTHGAQIDLRYEPGYPPTINDAQAAAQCRAAAQSVLTELGMAGAPHALPPSMGAEDFAYLARARPGCYVWLGNGPGAGGCLLHSPRYDFNDALISSGMRYWVRLVEKTLARV